MAVVRPVFPDFTGFGQAVGDHTPPSTDGRRNRRDRNRDSVVEAMLGLFDEGNFAPSSEEIAARAGLSARSLFRYFEDIDDLVRAAIHQQIRRVLPTVEVDVSTDRSLADRVESLVAQRLRMFDAMGAVGQVARLRANFHPLIAAELRQARAYLRQQIADLFKPELSALAEHEAQARVAAADVVTSFEGYLLLRDDQALERDACAEVLTTALHRLFA
jgi:AcrR family transcriptional regulator